MKNLAIFLIKGILISIVLFVVTFWSVHSSPNIVCNRVVITGHGFPQKATTVNYDITPKPDCKDIIVKKNEIVDLQISAVNYVVIAACTYLGLFMFSQLTKLISKFTIKKYLSVPAQLLFLLFITNIYYLTVVVGVFNERGPRPHTDSEIKEFFAHSAVLILTLWVVLIIAYISYQHFKTRRQKIS